MAQYAIGVVEKISQSGAEKVLTEAGQKSEAIRNLIEKVFDVKYNNEGYLTPESVDRIEKLSVHESLERASESLENINTFDISKLYNRVLDRVIKIENFLNRSNICDSKLQQKGNSMMKNGICVEWLRALIKQTREKVDTGIALSIRISFIISEARTLLSNALNFGEDKKALEEFCSKIDQYFPVPFSAEIDAGSFTLADKSWKTQIAELLSSKFENLGKLGVLVLCVLCGIGLVLIPAVLIVTSIANILLGIICVITGGVGWLITIPMLGGSRKLKLKALEKELEEIQGHLESVNRNLEQGLETVEGSNIDGGRGYSILLQAHRGFTANISDLKNIERFADKSEESIIEHIKQIDSDMGMVTKEIQQRFSVCQTDAWNILMFIHGCSKLGSAGELNL
ncbi:hypothetical protein LOD99_3728 [Oopsacas minuta]|uniref:Uncharacterized protein n=1 Tax=Oopsacas minuta TaxID=111878 RepID=A0AAV7JW00_9METZ|nr:hypothetical protein LOD99_3728 [Oopsacas minuta]